MALPQHLQTELLKIITLLKKHDTQRIFWEPVNAQALGIPTYYTIVTNPMDFTKIEKKLKQHVYLSVDEVAADVNQIWKNSEIFNGAQHDITLIAKELVSIFQKKFSLLKNSTSSSNSGSRKSLGQKSSFKYNELDYEKEYSLEEKRKICQFINNLGPNDMASVVHIIHANQPGLFFDTDNNLENVEIRIDEFNQMTLKDFEGLMNEHGMYL